MYPTQHNHQCPPGVISDGSQIPDALLCRYLRKGCERSVAWDMMESCEVGSTMEFQIKAWPRFTSLLNNLYIKMSGCSALGSCGKYTVWASDARQWL